MAAVLAFFAFPDKLYKWWLEAGGWKATKLKWRYILISGLMGYGIGWISMAVLHSNPAELASVQGNFSFLINGVAFGVVGTVLVRANFTNSTPGGERSSIQGDEANRIIEDTASAVGRMLKWHEDALESLAFRQISDRFYEETDLNDLRKFCMKVLADIEGKNVGESGVKEIRKNLHDLLEKASSGSGDEKNEAHYRLIEYCTNYVVDNKLDLRILKN